MNVRSSPHPLGQDYRTRHVLRGIILLAACALMALRAPLLLEQPRIWAEEGKVYLAYAYAHPTWKALLAPHQGYYHLFANLATLLALVVPMRRAALVTTWLAFIAQTIPLAIVLWGTAPLWRTLTRKFVVVAIILLTPSSAECWLNSINSQFYLAMAAALLLVEEPPRRRIRQWIYRGILGLAGLSGPVTAFLAPLFILRAGRRRQDREAETQAWIVVTGTMLQLGIILTSLETPPEGAVRFTGLSVTNLLAIVLNRTIVMPLVGRQVARHIAEMIQSWAISGSGRLLGWGLFLALAGWAFFLCWGRPSRQRYLVAASLVMATLSTVSALISPDQTKWVLVDPGTAVRYYYAPSVLMMLALWGRIDAEPRAWRRPASLVAAFALSICLLLGAADYRALMRPFVSDDWPVWKEQVSIWESRPGYHLQIWPPPWEMQLVRWD